MGRKSKSRSKKSNNHSIVIFHKSKQNKKKMIRTKKNIKKLFMQLRNESDASSVNNTVIEVQETPKKTLNSKNKSNNLIVIDDDLMINNEPCPLQCSTPMSKYSLRIQSPEKKLNNNTNSVQNFNEEVEDLTKEINEDSYLTIDLTTESLNATNPNVTVIDLASTSDVHDCSISDSISMSGDSDVTVINTKRKQNLELNNFAKGIEKLDSSERGKLLEYIARKIFNGCNGPDSSTNSLHSLTKNGASRATETAEDTYIKEVILGRASRNSIGSNIYNPERDIKNKTGLRMIVIDGSNVAMQHTKGRRFSVKGLKICIDYFVQRGHSVKAFVPHFRCKFGKSTDGRLLDQLERQGLVVYTPSREIQGRMITSYDDRYIVQCAAEFDGVIVSGDNYRDLLKENPRWRNVIENRLLQFTWVGDMIMFPRDPLGRDGPTLEQFLKHPSYTINDVDPCDVVCL